MNCRDYKEFIQERMRMSHVYQPIMLMTLLQGGGKASTAAIAKAIVPPENLEMSERMWLILPS